MPTFKKRLDLLAVEKGLFANPQIATSAIMSGALLVNGQKCTKPGTPVSANSQLETIPSWKNSPYVSRGGIKLEHALKIFHTNVHDRICLDIGASTGGFTDCLLQHGAAKIYAIDVGYGQIDWKLRQDPRVSVIERINARNLSPQILYRTQDLSSKADLAVIDVSFISITKILKACLLCMEEPNVHPAQTNEIICLIKPQFEADKENVKRGGIVNSASVHLDVLKSVTEFAQTIQLTPTTVTYSPIKGPAGNIEFFLRLQPIQHLQSAAITDADLEEAVNSAHQLLNSPTAEINY
jgi:23S rRNA (cytidine1920-2'-O)/16S rRNA (cytidine1409-2'-O)-methyltransferase